VKLDLKTRRQFKEVYQAIRALMDQPSPGAAPLVSQLIWIARADSDPHRAGRFRTRSRRIAV
jgi:hypothetical protein